MNSVLKMRKLRYVSRNSIGVTLDVDLCTAMLMSLGDRLTVEYDLENEKIIIEKEK